MFIITNKIGLLKGGRLTGEMTRHVLPAWFDLKCVRLMDRIVYLMPLMVDGEMGERIFRHIVDQSEIKDMKDYHLDEADPHPLVKLFTIYQKAMAKNNPYEYFAGRVKYREGLVLLDNE